MEETGMAIYRPDYQLEKAKKIINNLKKTEDNKLIKYYINSLEDLIKDRDEIISKYRDWFHQMDKFLPSKNTKIF